MVNKNILNKLSKSTFRNKFLLSDKGIEYINNKGIKTIEVHAYDFVNKRLKPKTLLNDGKQTPMKGHPVFVMQHATATCCRGCLYKWHKIEMNKELSDDEIYYIVETIMYSIKNEIKKENKYE